MRACYLKQKKEYLKERRTAWEHWLQCMGPELVDPPSKKCGCFWRGQDEGKCEGVGTKKDNLLGALQELNPQTVDVIKQVMGQPRDDESRLRKTPCPVCGLYEFHLWKECLCQGQFRRMDLGEGGCGDKGREPHPRPGVFCK